MSSRFVCSRLVYVLSLILYLRQIKHTESSVSKDYFGTVQHVLDHGVRLSFALIDLMLSLIFSKVKLVYIASLNDQVVPVYSGVFTSASHPLILRALYMDGDAYQYVLSTLSCAASGGLMNKYLFRLLLVLLISYQISSCSSCGYEMQVYLMVACWHTSLRPPQAL